MFKPYIDLAVIGYGNGTHSALPKIPLEKFPFSVTELPNTFIAKNVIDPNDNSMFPKPKREWVEARADAYTSMLAAFTKAGVELAYETMTKAGIKAESAYYESLHETPLIANLIARKKLFEMNRVISDTAEYGCYLFDHACNPLLNTDDRPGYRKASRGRQGGATPAYRGNARSESCHQSAEWSREYPYPFLKNTPGTA